jgi:hypothetical protein
MTSFEDEYIDVLQNIEMMILHVYREHADLLDYDVDKVLNLLWTEYRHEKINKTTPKPTLNANAQLVYDGVRQICEWRLGRKEMTVGPEFVREKPEPISIDEILACLKCILKSIKLWNKEGGRRGYLYFINNNLGV